MMRSAMTSSFIVVTSQKWLSEHWKCFGVFEQYWAVPIDFKLVIFFCHIQILYYVFWGWVSYIWIVGPLWSTPMQPGFLNREYINQLLRI
jgi:hypothetical protein